MDGRIYNISKFFIVFLSCTRVVLAGTPADWKLFHHNLSQGNIAGIKLLVPAKISLTDIDNSGLGFPAAANPVGTIQEYVNDWREIERYMASVKGTNNTAADPLWNKLIAAIESPDLYVIKEIVPSFVGPGALTRGGRVVRTIPPYLIGQAEDMLKYLAREDIQPREARARFPFYENAQPGYYLTNFYSGAAGETPELPGGMRLNLVIEGRSWKTTEHYYQAKKFPKHPAIAQKIFNEPTASGARTLAGSPENLPLVRPDWKGAVADSVMRLAVREKFLQNRLLAQLLVATYPKKLVEASPYDSYWGDPSLSAKGGVVGRNMLGTILMEVREELMIDKKLLKKIDQDMRALQQKI